MSRKAGIPASGGADVPRVDPAARRPDAFLSYSRRDGEAADRLVALLEERGKDIWIDRQDIPAASRWRDELARAIEVSDAVIALVTPSWAASENCRQELEHADAAGKRIIPVLAAPTGAVPEALASRQWVQAGSGDDMVAAADAIVEAIETDLPYVRAHARYLEEAQRWAASARDRGFLLRGGELRAAEAWLATRAERREPRPTADQISFIQASRSDATRRLRVLTVSALAAAAAVIVLAVVAVIQRDVAVDREHTARSRELAAVSEARRSSDPETAVRLAVEGLGVKRTGEAQIALRRAIAASPLVARFGRAGDELDDATMTGDGATVVTARDDGLVRAFDTATGHRRWAWRGAPGLQDLTVTEGDDDVAVGEGAGVVQVLDVADGTPVESFRVAAQGDVTAAVPSPDGRTIAGVTAQLSSLRGIAKLWERGTGRLIADLSAGADFAQRPVYSGDGRILVVPYYSGVARIWDARTGHLVHLLQGHTGPINSADVDPRGRWVVTGSDDGTARIWDAATGRQRFVLLRSSAAVRSVRFSPDGTRVAATGADGTAEVWDVRSGERVAVLSGHEAGVESAEFLDPATLVTGSLDGTARVWDLARQRQSAVLLGHGLGVTVAPGARAAHLLTFGAEGSARVWRLPAAATTTIGEAGSVDRISVGLDGRLIATERVGGLHVALWAVAPDRPPRRLQVSDRSIEGAVADDGSLFVFAGDGLRVLDRDGARVAELSTGGRPYSGVAVSPTGDRIAAARIGGGIDLWDPAGARLVASVAAGRGLPAEIHFSRDGSTVAYSEIGAPIVIVDAASGRLAGSVAPPEPVSLPAFAIDPAGRRVFRVDYGFPHKPIIVDRSGGAPTRLSGETGSALDSAIFSTDGSELLTAGGGAAQIWDARSGALLEEIARDRSRTSTAAFSPDDRLVVTGHDDGRVRVWDRATQALLGEFDGGPGPVKQVATGFGGTRLFAVGHDSTLRMFTCDACAPADRLPELARGHVAFGDLGTRGDGG